MRLVLIWHEYKTQNKFGCTTVISVKLLCAAVVTVQLVWLCTVVHSSSSRLLCGGEGPGKWRPTGCFLPQYVVQPYFLTIL